MSWIFFWYTLGIPIACPIYVVPVAQHTTLDLFYKFIQGSSLTPELREVLLKLCSLYGLWSLEKHSATLYQGSVHCHSEVVEMFA